MMIRKKRAQSYGYMDNEYTEGIWEHEINFTTAPGNGVDVASMLRGRREDEFLGSQRGSHGRY